MVFVEFYDFRGYILAQTSQKVVAYLRVSTIDQDLSKNKAEILHLANNEALGQVKFIEEKSSGKISWRKRKIATILDSLHSGDVIIVNELSRLGRSMLECMEILSIAIKKDIRLYSVKGNWQLDDSIQSKIMAMAFSMAAEIERDLISKRTIEALHAKKVAGIALGRPKGPGKSKLDKFRSEIKALITNGSTQKFIATKYDTTPSNLSNWLKKNKIKRVEY